MTLSQKQFSMLTLLEKKLSFRTQRELAAALQFSLGTTNKILGQLQEAGLIANYAITDLGLEEMCIRDSIYSFVESMPIVFDQS